MSVLELVGERRASKQEMHIVCGWEKVAASRQATGRAFCSWYLCVSESRSQRSAFRLCSFGLGSRLRFYSPRPFHPFASVVEEWIASEVSLYGVCPTARLGAWLSLLPQNDKDSCRCLAERTRSKQPKAPNSVLIAFRNVLSPTVNELLQ